MTTFEDFLNKFQEEVNKQERHRLGTSKMILDQYEFRLEAIGGEGPANKHNTIRDNVLNSLIVDDIEAKQKITNLSVEGDVRSEVERNTSIKKVLERFLSRNAWMQKQISGIRAKLTAENWYTKDVDDIELDKYIFTITTHNHLLSYDPMRRDYARKFIYTITITPYTSIATSVKNEYMKSKAYTKNRVEWVRQQKRLVKRYDYFNTGMNIDVTNFDINYNFQYVYGLDTMVGLFNKYSDAFNTAINTQNTSNQLINNAKETKQIVDKEWNSASGDGVLTSGEKYSIKKLQEKNLQNIKQMWDSGAVEPDANTLEAYEALVSDYNASFKNFSSGLSPAAGAPELNAIKGVDPTWSKNVLSNTTNINQRVSRIGSNNILAEKISDEQYSEALKDDPAGGTLFPVQFYERFTSPGDGGIIEVASEDASFFNTTLRNAKVGSYEMVNCTMDIIGDPYWLDKPKLYADDSNSYMPEKENLILFCSLFPAEQDPITGYTKTIAQRSNEFLTAIYRVWRIDNTFENGMFTQRLYMIRDGITDLSLLLAGDIKETKEEAKDKGMIADAHLRKKKFFGSSNLTGKDVHPSRKFSKYPIPHITVEFGGSDDNQVIMNYDDLSEKAKVQAQTWLKGGIIDDEDLIDKDRLKLIEDLTLIQTPLNENALWKEKMNQLKQIKKVEQAEEKIIEMKQKKYNLKTKSFETVIKDLARPVSNFKLKRSDIKLKEDIQLIGKSPSNINIYSFKYKEEQGYYEGVMAHEVPWASEIGKDGFLRVDYSKIDVNFKTIEDYNVY